MGICASACLVVAKIFHCITQHDTLHSVWSILHALCLTNMWYEWCMEGLAHVEDHKEILIVDARYRIQSGWHAIYDPSYMRYPTWSNELRRRLAGISRACPIAWFFWLGKYLVPAGPRTLRRACNDMLELFLLPSWKPPNTSMFAPACLLVCSVEFFHDTSITDMQLRSTDDAMQ